jgi:protease IV
MFFELLQYRAWALSESYFTRIYPIVMDRLNKGTIDGLIKKKTAEEFLPALQSFLSVEEGLPPVPIEMTSDVTVSYDRDSGFVVASSNNKKIALISIIGPVTKYGDLCTMGMQEYGSLIQRANASPSIDGIVLIMDTPGGTVDGTPELGMIIAQSQKPIGVFGDSMVASAGMWLASQSDVIVGNKNNPTRFGSIGTLMVMENWQNVIDAGFAPKMEIIRAPQSTDKARLNSIEPMTDEIRAGLLSELRAITNQFISIVKTGRGEKLQSDAEGLFTGQMFDVYQAKQIGLIDHIGTLQTTINKVVELAKAQSKTTSQSQINNNENHTMDLLAFLGLSKEQKAKLSAEDQSKLDTLEANVTATEKKNSELEAEKVSLTKTVSDNESKIAALEQTIAEQKAQLEKKPTGTATTVIAEPDKAEEKYLTSIDAEKKKYSSN